MVKIAHDGEFKMAMPFTKGADEERIVSGFASTDQIDSQGDSISIEALRDAVPEYMRYPTLRRMHAAEPIGRTIRAEVNERGLRIEARVVDDAAWQLVRGGVLTAFSVGGKVIERSGNVIKRLALREISLVDLPANRECALIWKSDMGASKRAIETRDDGHAEYLERVERLNAGAPPDPRLTHDLRDGERFVDAMIRRHREYAATCALEGRSAMGMAEWRKCDEVLHGEFYEAMEVERSAPERAREAERQAVLAEVQSRAEVLAKMDGPLNGKLGFALSEVLKRDPDLSRRYNAAWMSR